MVTEEPQAEDRGSALNLALDDVAVSAKREMPPIWVGPRGIRWVPSIEASQVMEMVACLPIQMREEKLPASVRLACLEAFLGHVRSMVEFFGVRRSDSRDFTARSVVPDWKRPVKAEADRLNGYWITASQQVMQFSNSRTPQPDGPWPMLTPKDPVIDAMSADLLTVWDRFAAAVNDPRIAPPRNSLRRFVLEGRSERPRRPSFMRVLRWSSTGEGGRRNRAG